MESEKLLKNVLVFDTETTGLPDKNWNWETDFEKFPRIVQLAWAFNDKEKSYIIYPEKWEIPQETIEVHGITPERALNEGVKFADVIDEFLEDCEKAHLLVGHNVYFDVSIVKAMILFILGREYYDKKADKALFKGKRIDTMMKSIRFVGAKFPNGRPGKFPNLTELYQRCFPGETFPAHDALADVLAVRRCIPVLVENGVIELKQREYPAEQLKLEMQPQELAKTKTAKRVIEFKDNPAIIPGTENFSTKPDNCPETGENSPNKADNCSEATKRMLAEEDF